MRDKNGCWRRRAAALSVPVTSAFERGLGQPQTCSRFATLREFGTERQRARDPRRGLRLAVDANWVTGSYDHRSIVCRGGHESFEDLCEKLQSEMEKGIAARLQVWPRTRHCLLRPLNLTEPGAEQAEALGQKARRQLWQALKAEAIWKCQGRHYSPFPSPAIMYFQLQGTQWHTNRLRKTKIIEQAAQRFMFARRIKGWRAPRKRWKLQTTRRGS